MSFELPKLPYELDGLAPHISKETLEYHYGKHHNAYVTKLNGMVEGKPYASQSLEEVIVSAREKGEAGVFNNAAQVWNHTFYFEALSASESTPSGGLSSAIDSSFESFDKFKETFLNKAATLFGSGWTWLVKTQDGSLDILQTQNAETPVGSSNTPLLTCDVWEHAYYVDYRNARPKYLEAYWSLINWDKVQARFEG